MKGSDFMDKYVDKLLTKKIYPLEDKVKNIIYSEIQQAQEKAVYYLSYFEDTGNYKYSTLSDMYFERAKKLEELETKHGQTKKVLEYQDELIQTLVEIKNKINSICNSLEDDGDWVEAMKQLQNINKVIDVRLRR